MTHNKCLLSILGIIIICESLFTGLLPISRGHLFSLLTAKVGPIWLAIGFYFLNYLAIDFFQSVKGYVVLKCALWYREWRTRIIYAKLKLRWIIHTPTNSPQRIQEDIKLSYLQRITVWTEYSISTIILIQLFILNLSEPLLILFALGYAGISVVIALLFNPRLTKAEIDVQQSEASYRTGLVNKLTDISGMTVANNSCLSSKWIQTEYLLFTKLQLGLVTVLPYIVLLPKLLNGTIDLGKVIEHQATFGLIVVNAAILIQLYTTYIQGKASEQRVKEIEVN